MLPDGGIHHKLILPVLWCRQSRLLHLSEHPVHTLAKLLHQLIRAHIQHYLRVAREVHLPYVIQPHQPTPDYRWHPWRKRPQQEGHPVRAKACSIRSAAIEDKAKQRFMRDLRKICFLFHHPRRHAHRSATDGYGLGDHGAGADGGIFADGSLVDDFHSRAAIYAFFD